MANNIKRGESLFIPFENGESIYDSQLKPRMYKTREQYDRFSYRFKDAELVEYAEVVRCKDCKHFKPAHFKADDGTETPWDETFSWDDRSDGIYHGGKCKHDRNTAYGQKDMAFRKPDDFCSYGERRSDV